MHGRVFERAVFPGGVYEEVPYVHHVYAIPEKQNMPVRIDRVGPDGLSTSAEFSHYFKVDTPLGTTYWPRGIVLRAYDGAGGVVGSISYVITEFSLNEPIPAEVFTIERGEVAKVWNDDLRQFE
jgi:hypothetical protein